MPAGPGQRASRLCTCTAVHVHVQYVYVYVYGQELVVVARHSVRPATRGRRGGCTRTRTPGPRVLSLSLSLALARVRAGSPPAAGGEIPSRARRAHSLWGARFLVPVRPRSRGERRCLKDAPPPTPPPRVIRRSRARLFGGGGGDVESGAGGSQSSDQDLERDNDAALNRMGDRVAMLRKVRRLFSTRPVRVLNERRFLRILLSRPLDRSPGTFTRRRTRTTRCWMA